MNFNFPLNAEYALNTQMTEEVINLYGILVKFLIAQKINRDDLVFGDYSHLKTDNNKIYDIHMMPENSTDWDHSDAGFNQFGLNNFENITLFVSKKNIIDYVPDLALNRGTLTGNLVVLPNHKIMEITSAMWEVPGVNNIFTSPVEKSVIRLSCKPYDDKLISEVSAVDVSVDPAVPYDTLDVYFNDLIAQTTAQDKNAEVTPSVVTTVKTGGVDTSTVKPPVQNIEKDVWGAF